MADMMFPAEYQSQIDAEERKRKMAQALFQQSMGFKGAQSQGAIASRTPLFATLANTGAGMLGAFADAQSSGNINKVKQKYQADESADLARIMGLPEEEQIKQGPLSQFSRSRELAKTLRDRNERRVTTAAPIIAETDPVAAVNAVRSGQLPSTMASPKLPEFGTTPGANGAQIPIVTNYGKGNRATASFGPGAPSTNTLTATTGGAVDYKAVIDDWQADLKTKREGAAAAKAVLGSNRNAIEALERGAMTGGLEGYKQATRKFAQGFNIPNAATAPTEELNMALGEQILAKARALAPVTEADLLQLKEILGSMNTDPTALTRALAYTTALAHKGLSDYGDYMTSREDSVKGTGTPELRDKLGALLSGQRVGYEPQTQLFGPQSFQIETARQLKNSGYDIKKLKLPKGLAEDLEAGIRTDMAGAFPAMQKAGVAQQSNAAKGPKPAAEMTQAERDAEAAALKKRLGIK